MQWFPSIPARTESRSGWSVSPRIPLTPGTNCPPPSLAGTTEPCTQTHPTTLVNRSPTRAHSSTRIAWFLLFATAYLSSLSCLCENNVHMCYVWAHELAQMHQNPMKQQINPCTLPAAGQFWLHWRCRNRWRQCCRHAQPGGADCFGTCPSSWCACISGGQVPLLPIKKCSKLSVNVFCFPPSVWSFVVLSHFSDVTNVNMSKPRKAYLVSPPHIYLL